MIGLVTVLLGTMAAAPDGATALQTCRTLDREFDTKNMPPVCAAAAEDASLPLADRVEALRRLAFAHILNGDEALAEPAYLQMLVFDADVVLPADAGPRFQAIFDEVKRRFEVEGALGVSFTPVTGPADAPVPVALEVQDKLGRVVTGRVRAAPVGAAGNPLADPVDARLERTEVSPGVVRFSGTVPEPETLPAGTMKVQYEIELEGWDGTPLATPSPLRGAYQREASAMGGEPSGPPWLLIGGASAGAVLLAGAVAAGTVYCFTAGPCRYQDAWVRVQVRQVPE